MQTAALLFCLTSAGSLAMLMFRLPLVAGGAAELGGWGMQGRAAALLLTFYLFLFRKLVNRL